MKSFTQHMEDFYLAPINEGLNPFKAVHDYLNADVFLHAPVHEMQKKGITVRHITNPNIAKKRFSTNFEASHTFDIHGEHYIIGKELGHEGTKIYRVNHVEDDDTKDDAKDDDNTSNKKTPKPKKPKITYTGIDGFRLLHDHPELTATHIGRQIYSENKEAFKVLPLTASKEKLQHVMKLDPKTKIGGVSVGSMQWIAARHHNADKSVTNAALASPHKIGFNTMRRLLTVHGIDRAQAVKIKNMPHLMQNPHIAAAVTNRLARP